MIESAKDSGLFCNRPHVEKILRGKRIALVGSGPGVLDNFRGFVDSHDVVIRVNNYKLSFATGHRTDVHYSFYGRSIKKSTYELSRDGVYLCMCKCPDMKFMESAWHKRRRKTNGTDFRYIYEERKNFWFCPVWISENFMHWFKLLGNHVPTTGFAALQDVLTFKPKSIYMTGFDFFESGIHNVDESWRPQNKHDPIRHVPQAELKWLKDNIGNIPVTVDVRLNELLSDHAVRVQKKPIPRVSKVRRRK